MRQLAAVSRWLEMGGYVVMDLKKRYKIAAFKVEEAKPTAIGPT